MKQQLKFHDRNKPFGVLVNTSNLKVEFSINGNLKIAPSSESIYQAVKGILNPDQAYHSLGQAILNGEHGYAKSVQIVGQSFDNSNKIQVIHKHINGKAETLKDYIMYDIVKAKLTQHPILLRALIEKVQAGYEIIADNPYDNYWGIGNNGMGQNKLGKIITLISEELSLEMKQTEKFKICNSFSSQTTAMIKTAGLIEPKAADISDKFINISSFNDLPTNYTTEAKITNYYSSNDNNQINTDQKVSTIKATDMRDLAKQLINKGQFGQFITRSHNEVKVEYKVQFDKVIIETISKAIFYRIEYNTQTNSITENGTMVSNSALGDWAFRIIKSHANTMAAMTSSKLTLIPVSKNSNYKNFFKKVIKQEPDCKFEIKAKDLTVIIRRDKEIIIKGMDKHGDSITIKELVNGDIFENNDLVVSSEYLKQSLGSINWALNHSDQITVEALGIDD